MPSDVSAAVWAGARAEPVRFSSALYSAARNGDPLVPVDVLPSVELAPPRDKYALAETPDIDCASRLALCQARCCRLAFSLTRQDLAEGVVRWDPARMFRNERSGTGECVHLVERRCVIYAQRPGVCRTYDCRGDTRIWKDFDRRIPAAPPDA